jgi:hypothetical protein
VEIRVVRSGRRHKIGNQHILDAMIDAGEPTPIGDQLHYLGTYARGIEPEIIAVPDDLNPGGLAIIHAMPTEFREPGEEDNTV